jgi:hypothetical protein
MLDGAMNPPRVTFLDGLTGGPGRWAAGARGWRSGPGGTSGGPRAAPARRAGPGAGLRGGRDGDARRGRLRGEPERRQHPTHRVGLGDGAHDPAQAGTASSPSSPPSPRASDAGVRGDDPSGASSPRPSPWWRGDIPLTNDVFAHDRQTGITTRVSVASDGRPGDGSSIEPAVSGDGRFVVFRSIASNLVVGDTNRQNDIFVHDRHTGTTTRVSVASDGTQGNGTRPAISGDGRFVAFESAAASLRPQAHVRQGSRTARDVRRGALHPVRRAAEEVPAAPARRWSSVRLVTLDATPRAQASVPQARDT